LRNGGLIEQIILLTLVSSFEESREELAGMNIEIIDLRVIQAGMSQSDEMTFSRVRNSKRGKPNPRQIDVVRSPINFYPGFTVQRALNHPGLHIVTPDCVMSGAGAQLAEIPVNPLTETDL
jgi:hypothetical protein